MKSSTFSQAQFLKKQSEVDQQALRNRVALLEQEEQRTYKKVEETRRKLQEVYQVRELKQERKKVQQEKAYRNSKELSVLKETLKQVRVNRKHRLDLTQASLYRSKLDNSHKIKLLLTQEQYKKEQYEQRKLNEYKQKIQTLKKENLLRTDRIHNFRLKKHEACRNEVQRKEQDDYQYTVEREKDINFLRQAENEMVNKLNTTQALYQQAIDELEFIATKTYRY